MSTVVLPGWLAGPPLLPTGELLRIPRLSGPDITVLRAGSGYAALGTAPGRCHHCHTGMCPVG
jgi:hypothetical protein